MNTIGGSLNDGLISNNVGFNIIDFLIDILPFVSGIIVVAFLLYEIKSLLFGKNTILK